MLSALSILLQNVQKVKGDFFCPAHRNGRDFSFLVCGQTTLWQTRLQPGMFHNPCPFGVRMANSTYFMSQVNVNHPHAHQVRHRTFVPNLIQMNCRNLSCVANMTQDIDSLGLGCEWLFMKSINSAAQLSGSTQLNYFTCSECAAFAAES